MANPDIPDEEGKISIKGEGLAKLTVTEGVFFNPHMQLCRSIASLWVGTLPSGISAIDGFCASGARGIRYAVENKNIADITLIDMSEKACANAKRNITANKLGKRAKVVKADIREFLLGREIAFDFIEIDPFGTPVPFLSDIMRAGDKRKVKYLSATATDMAVLCGAHHAACIKNYQSRPLNSEFCHENAVRILLGKIAREAAQENYGTEVEFSISHRHYVKVFVRLEPSADKAVESAKLAMAYVSFCHKCGWRELSKFPQETCATCGAKADFGGQMWGGKLFDAAKVAKMNEIQAKRGEKVGMKKEIDALLSTMQSECELPPFYYDLHEMASRRRIAIAAVDKVVAELKKGGFAASRTHFSTTSVRTNAGVEDVGMAMKSASKPKK